MAKDILIDVSRSMARKLLVDYRSRQETLKAQLLDIQSELDDVEELIASIANQLDAGKIYNPKWYKWEKVEYALQSLGKLSTVSEIIDELRKYEPELTAPAFHATLSQKIDANSIFVRYNSKSHASEYVYGLREWLDDSGRMSSKYFNDPKNEVELSHVYVN